MPFDNNPYAPPSAAVDDANGADEFDTFVPGGRTCEMNRGLAWFSAGWEMFKQSPGMWVLLLVVYLVLNALLNIIPLLNFFSAFLALVLSGGIAYACDQQRQHGELKIADLFAGFQQNFTSLLLVALLYIAAFVVVAVVCGVLFAILMSIFGGSGNLAAFAKGTMPHLGAGALVFGAIFLLLFVIALVALVSTIIFAPALVMLQGLAPFEAMKQSYSGCWRNIGAGFIYCVVGVILAIVATIPLGLGWIVLLPVATASIYCAYRDIYFDN